MKVCRWVNSPSCLVNLLRSAFLASMMTGAVTAFATPGVEIVPVAVWQGKPSHPWSVAKLQEIRKEFPGLRIAHAVDGASLVRGGVSEAEFRENFARAVAAGDDVLLHVAPWKSLADKAGVTFKSAPTVFGAPLDLDNCADDCGLELSFKAFSASESRAIIAESKSALSDAGFGVPDAVYFDEGVVSPDLRSAAHKAGLSQDWSGIELTQLNGALGGFPIYQWNLDNEAELPVADTSVVSESGLLLDHVRFSTHAEAGDLDGAVKIYQSAVDAAKKSGRVARIAIVFNVEDLIHTYGFISGAMSKAIAVIQEAGVPITEWKALNSSWSLDKIRGAKANAAINVAESPSDEPEFIPTDEMDDSSIEPGAEPNSDAKAEPTIEAH